MDHAHVLQRAGRDLSGFHGRGRTGARHDAAGGALSWSAVLFARECHFAHLHRRLAFLRRESLAGIPQHRTQNMTRRGTLAYYLAAWVVGCFVVSLMAAIFVDPGAESAPVDGPARLLILYFLALLYGAADILLFAFLLRRVMRLFSSYNLIIWMIAGAVLGAAAVRILLGAGDALVGMSPLTGRGLISFFLLMFWTAPNALRLAGIWQAPVAGAAI